MRLIETHKGSAANERIQIQADDKGPGGASHKYDIFVGPIEKLSGDCAVSFQCGAIQEVGPNGITDEALMAVLIDRLRGFQSGPFSCRQNALALTKMEEALHWMNSRTSDRVERGVEGFSKA